MGPVLVLQRLVERLGEHVLLTGVQLREPLQEAVEVEDVPGAGRAAYRTHSSGSVSSRAASICRCRTSGVTGGPRRSGRCSDGGFSAWPGSGGVLPAG
jgi:hypothetical protein